MNVSQCVDVFGTKAIFARLQAQANDVESKLDPGTIILSRTEIVGGLSGYELLAEWCKQIDDGWERSVTKTPSGVTLSVCREQTMILQNASRTVRQETTHRAQLMNVEFAALTINGEEIHEPFATQRTTEHLIKLVYEKKNSAKPIRYVNNIYGSLKYLPTFLKRCPDVTVYNLLDIRHLVTGEEPGERPHIDVDALGDVKSFFSFPHTWDLAPVESIVDDVLNRKMIHLVAGMYESYKSMAVSELVSAVLEFKDNPERRAFEHFAVKMSFDVLYCCLDMPAELQVDYWENFRLIDQSEKGRFQGITPGSQKVEIDSPLMQAAVKGKVLVLDTLVDYARVKDAFQSEEWVLFMGKLRFLISNCGCEAIILLTHPTKAGAREDRKTIDPVEFIKDSITIGGKIDVAFAFKKKPKSSLIFVKRLKSRGFKENNFTFTITTHDEEGESFISQGKFPVHDKPGEAGSFKVRELTSDLNQANAKLSENSDLLAKSTEDIHVLLAFIKSKGLIPPKINHAA